MKYTSFRGESGKGGEQTEAVGHVTTHGQMQVTQGGRCSGGLQKPHPGWLPVPRQMHPEARTGQEGCDLQAFVLFPNLRSFNESNWVEESAILILKTRRINYAY